MLVLALSMSSASFAQSLTTWTWEDYGLSFKAPSNAKVQKNTDTEFVATNGNIIVGLEVIDYTGATMVQLAEALGEYADAVGFSADTEVGGLQLTTLAGVWIEGTLDGTNTILVVLADDDSNIAVVAAIQYADGQEKIATAIVNSFSIK